MSYNGSCSNDGIVANFKPGKNNRMRANPYIFPNFYWEAYIFFVI